MPTDPGSLPATLALIDDDPEYTEYLGQTLRERGVAVTVFADSDEFLTSAGAFDFEFFVIDLTLPGVDGLDLVRLIRRKGPAGIVGETSRSGGEVPGRREPVAQKAVALLA